MRRPETWALSLLLAGCAVGPDYRGPPTPAARRYTTAPLAAPDAAQRYVSGLDIPGQWWTLFHAPALNALVTRALAANPSLQSAQSALRQAREALYAQESNFLPTVSATYEPTRNKTALSALSPASSSGSPYYTLHTAQLTISYAPDVWGLTRRQVEDQVAQTEAQRFQLEATYLTLTSNIVTGAIAEASLRDQVADTYRIIDAEQGLLSVLQKQYALGQIAEVDVLAQQTALAQAQATLPSLKRQLSQVRDAMATYLGQSPDVATPETFTLSQIRLPKDLPVSVPAALVNQRPDVLQAAATLHAACANLGVAIANRLPQLVLSAQGGSQANHFQQLFAGQGNVFWSLAASVTEPIFDAGQLLHKQRAARAALEQATADYKSTALQAFQNVADTLAALQADADALAAEQKAERAASETLRIVRLQVSLGQAAYLAILNSQQAALQTELTLTQARASRLSDTAALFQALGGGWWHRQDVRVPDLGGNDVGQLLKIGP